ncbi:hypothetical protein [Cyanobium sp. ATX 6F1]|uniref:hypothetical protein n=1 Tax=unclassified Cyanobium TaxID=2627006 RepID=UPI0020CC049F|nr:hypothetical protein [Cyanobium sp. ATX 6F1]MCP9916006.1 hypothetical protein [Cyanobium sp. ATX 6F1]
MPADGQGSADHSPADRPSTGPGAAEQDPAKRRSEGPRSCADVAGTLDRRAIAERLSNVLGVPVEVVSRRDPVRHRVSGLAVCSGKVLSYVIDAQARTVATRNLLQLTRRSREAA